MRKWGRTLNRKKAEAPKPTRRKKGTGSVVQKDGKWLGRIRENGTTRYVTDPRDTAAQAESDLDRYLGYRVDVRALPSFEDYYAASIAPGGVLEARLDPQTLNLYDTAGAKSLYGTTLGKMRLDKIRKVDIQKHVDRMYATWKPSTVETYAGKYRVVLQLAVDEEILVPRLEAGRFIPANPADGIKYRPRIEPGAVILDEKQLGELPAMMRAYSDRLADMFTVMVDTGVRPGELCAMTAEDIAPGVWRVSDTRKRNGKLKGTTKTGLHRHIALSSEAETIIARQGVKAGPVWLTKEGDPMRPDNFARQLRRFFESAQRKIDADAKALGVEPVKLAKVHARDLRKTFVTRAMEIGDLKAVQAIVGHRSAKTTADVYAKTRNARHAPLMEALSKAKQKGTEGGEEAA